MINGAFTACVQAGEDWFRCAAAADANDDGRVDYADVTYLLNWMERPAGPFECGEVELDNPDFCRGLFSWAARVGLSPLYLELKEPTFLSRSHGKRWRSSAGSDVPDVQT